LERRNRIDRSGKEEVMKRAFRWAVVSVGLASVVIASTLAPGGATPPAGFTSVPLALATNTSNGTIPLQAGTDIAMAQITVDPGGSSGWHSHPGGAIVLVKQGTVTMQESVGGKCMTMTYTAGQAFVERSGQVLQALNRGTIPYVLFVTFPRVPHGELARTDEPDPGTCQGS
jgi:quercetin dioxygenase-like cupin family protein